MRLTRPDSEITNRSSTTLSSKAKGTICIQVYTLPRDFVKEDKQTESTRIAGIPLLDEFSRYKLRSAVPTDIYERGTVNLVCHRRLLLHSTTYPHPQSLHMYTCRTIF